MTNYQNSFSSNIEIDFVPSKCQWFEIGIKGAFSGTEEINLLPGDRDVNFQLTLKQNSQVDCTDFNFYDKFNSIDF